MQSPIILALIGWPLLAGPVQADPDWRQAMVVGIADMRPILNTFAARGGFFAYTFCRTPLDEKLTFALNGMGSVWQVLPDPAGPAFPRAELRESLSLAPTFRAYFRNHGPVRPYLQVSAGPARLSSAQWGYCAQKYGWTFQDTLALGLELGPRARGWDVSLLSMHYSNGELFLPNQNINIPFLLTAGFRF